MTNESTASVNIPKDLLEPILKAHMTNALNEALGSQGDILQKAVNLVLNHRVDSSGKISCSTYDKTTWFEWMVQSTLRDCAKDVLKECVEEYRDQIRTEIERQLKANKSKIAKGLAESMADGFTQMASNYRLSVNLAFDEVKQS